MNLSSLDVLARRQHGVVHRDQSGLTRQSWRRAVEAGTLIEVHRNVARLVGTEPTEVQRIQSATLAVPDSVASHRSAAVMWGLVASDDVHEVHVTTLVGSEHRDLEGVRCHRPTDRLDVRGVTRAGIATTPPVRTLVDLGATDAELVEGAVGAALANGLLTINGLEAGLQRHSERGRHGVTALRSAVDHWAIDARPADSILEVAFEELCRRHRLPPTSFHERIEGWEVDFRFLGTAILVECDGWTTHGRRRHQFEQDRRKDDDLRAAGWIPARVTYRAVTQHGADVARRLRRLLDRWGHVSAPDETPVPDLDPAA